MAMRNRASTSGSAAGNDGRGESMVIDVGRRKSSCGYCKSGASTSITHGLLAESLTVDDYQALLDRGWRRSGCFLYKPDMKKTCCTSYTIRLKASDFVPSKEQTRVSKKMQRFLDGALDVQKDNKLNGELPTSEGSCSNACDQEKNATDKKSSAFGCDGKDKLEQIMIFLSGQVDNAAKSYFQSGEFSSGIQLPKASIKKVASAKRKLQAEVSEELAYSCNIAFQIAATVKRLMKDSENGKSLENGMGRNKDSSELSPKTIAENLAGHLKHLDSCGMSCRASNGHINFYSAKQAKAPKIEKVEKGRIIISSPPASVTNGRHLEETYGGLQHNRRKLEIRMRRSCFDSEEYSLYRKYQMQVHHETADQVTEKSYTRFLVDTPLVYVEPSDDGTVPPCGFGSFHQQYVLDGRLIAVGVVDILPKCLSSKYLFWDPDLASLSLGKYSVLQEIKWVRENQLHCSSLQYYYLGYYIHSCRKMSYKAAYRPSELLCPLRYEWVLYDNVKPLLDRQKYVVLSDWPSLQTGDSLPGNDLGCGMETHQNDSTEGTPNDMPVNDDEMTEADSDFSDSESDTEASYSTHLDNINSVLLGLRGARLRFMEVQHAIDPRKREAFKNRLQRYANVVGAELSKRMVYSLG